MKDQYSRVDVQERSLGLGHMAFRAARLAEVCVVADPAYECWQNAPLYMLQRDASVHQTESATPLSTRRRWKMRARAASLMT